MKILIISHEALASDIAIRLKNENNEIKFFIGSPKSKDICDGLIEKVEDYNEWINWADLILFDDVGFGEIQDELRKQGKLVIGGSEEGDRLESDRAYGERIMQEICKVNVPRHSSFKDFDEAIKFIKQNKAKWIIKFNKNVANWKPYLYIAEDEDSHDLIDVINPYKENWNSVYPVDFILQEKAEGIEIACGDYFDGTDFSLININFEHKRLCNGDLGAMTGEMGTIIKFVDQDNPLFKQTIEPLKDLLRKSNYKGSIDLNCIINGNGIYGLEFTSRFGYPAICIEMEGLKEPLGEIFYKIAKGEYKETKARTDWLIGVVIAKPPFPFENEKQAKNTLISYPEYISDKVHFGDVKIKDGKLVSAGEIGYCLIITNHGKTIKEAREKVYLDCKEIRIANKFYRTDIGERVIRVLNKLEKYDLE